MSASIIDDLRQSLADLRDERLTPVVWQIDEILALLKDPTSAQAAVIRRALGQAAVAADRLTEVVKRLRGAVS